MFESSVCFSSTLKMVYGSYGSAVHKAVMEYDALLIRILINASLWPNSWSSSSSIGVITILKAIQLDLTIIDFSFLPIQ